MTGSRAIHTIARRLRTDRRGMALMEFAFTMPLLLMAGMYGIEVANLALINLRISQIALNLADNASRVGNTPLTTQQLREVDVNDILQAARYQGAGIDLTTRGRIVLSSLENVSRTFADGTMDTAPVQRIHWQRCLGMMGSAAADVKYRSSYGDATPLTTAGTDTTTANAGVTKASGMGDTGAMVSAPATTGVIFVEVNYKYKPLLSGFLFGNTERVHYVASFIVRDNRDFAQLFNPSPAVSTTSKLTCDRYTS